MNEEFVSPNWGIPPTLDQLLVYWINDVKRMDEWKRIDIDEYLEYMYGRKSIQDKLETESLTPEKKASLDEADKFFMNITKETEKSILFMENYNPATQKAKYWFAYRLLKSKYDTWLLYAQF